MQTRDSQLLIKEIDESLSKFVSNDAKNTILTIRNLIESNARVEESIDQLHKTINHSNQQNEKLQKRVYYLTVVTVILTLVQVVTVLVQLLNRS